MPGPEIIRVIEDESFVIDASGDGKHNGDNQEYGDKYSINRHDVSFRPRNEWPPRLAWASGVPSRGNAKHASHLPVLWSMMPHL